MQNRTHALFFRVRDEAGNCSLEHFDQTTHQSSEPLKTMMNAADILAETHPEMGKRYDAVLYKIDGVTEYMIGYEFFLYPNEEVRNDRKNPGKGQPRRDEQRGQRSQRPRAAQ